MKKRLSKNRGKEEEGTAILIESAVRLMTAPAPGRRRSRSSTGSQTSVEELTSNRERKINHNPDPVATGPRPQPPATPPRTQLHSPAVTPSPTCSSPTSQLSNDDKIINVNQWLQAAMAGLRLSPRSRTAKREKAAAFSRQTSERASGGKATSRDDSGTFSRQSSGRASGGKAAVRDEHRALSRQSSGRASSGKAGLGEGSFSRQSSGRASNGKSGSHEGSFSRQSSGRASGGRPAWNAGVGLREEPGSLSRQSSGRSSGNRRKKIFPAEINTTNNAQNSQPEGLKRNTQQRRSVKNNDQNIQEQAVTPIEVCQRANVTEGHPEPTVSGEAHIDHSSPPKRPPRTKRNRRKTTEVKSEELASALMYKTNRACTLRHKHAIAETVATEHQQDEVEPQRHNKAEETRPEWKPIPQVPVELLSSSQEPLLNLDERPPEIMEVEEPVIVAVGNRITRGFDIETKRTTPSVDSVQSPSVSSSNGVTTDEQSSDVPTETVSLPVDLNQVLARESTVAGSSRAWHTEGNLSNARSRIPVRHTARLPPAPQSATKSTGAIPKAGKSQPDISKNKK